MNCIIKKIEKKVYINSLKNLFIIDLFLDEIFFVFFRNYLIFNKINLYYLFKNFIFFKNYLNESGILR